jgi:hypothetical protein
VDADLVLPLAFRVRNVRGLDSFSCFQQIGQALDAGVTSIWNCGQN